MNNPLEAVTQAVNSLVTALKLPDESAKANEVLGEMSFPQFSRLLPYRDYNQESGLFMNDTTMGFMLEMDAFKERVIRNSLRPPAVPGIGRTEKYGSRLFDPSVRLAAESRMNGCPVS